MERKYDEFVGVDSVYAAVLHKTNPSFVTEAPEFLLRSEIVGKRSKHTVHILR